MMVYVAGSSAEIDRAKDIIGRLRRAGLGISYDWTPDLRSARKAGHSDDASLSEAQALGAAQSCLEGVFMCDVFLLLAPERPTRGAWVELGYALASQCQVVVAGPAAKQSIFAQCAREVTETDGDAVQLITAWSAL